LPQGLQNIRDSFCSGCTSLQTLTLPQGIHTIGGWFCAYCTSLQTLTLPQGIQTIRDNFCWNCISLRHLTLPATLNSVGRDCLTSYDYITGTYFLLDIGAFEEIKIADTTLDVIGTDPTNTEVAEQLRQQRDHLEGVAG
jgi:hypothetical protein